MQVGWIAGFVDDQILRASAARADVGICGVEVHIGRNVLPGLDQAGGQDILGGAALVSRYEVLKTKYIVDGYFETLE